MSTDPVGPGQGTGLTSSCPLSTSQMDTHLTVSGAGPLQQGCQQCHGLGLQLLVHPGTRRGSNWPSRIWLLSPDLHPTPRDLHL